jgi:hypothetical protein
MEHQIQDRVLGLTKDLSYEIVQTNGSSFFLQTNKKSENTWKTIGHF